MRTTMRMSSCSRLVSRVSASWCRHLRLVLIALCVFSLLVCAALSIKVCAGSCSTQSATTKQMHQAEAVCFWNRRFYLEQ